MTDSFEDARTALFTDLSSAGDNDAKSTIIKNIKTLAEAEDLLTPDPIVIEPKGFKAFLSRNSGDLIKVGGTATVVLLIGLIETRGDVIFRSKASKFI